MRAITPSQAEVVGVNPYYHGPIWNAFGLGRAAYLVVPRRTLQSMPLDWQQKFVALMDEAQAALSATAFPEYSVQRKEAGRFVTDPLRDYRHTGPIKAVTTLATVKPPRDLRTKVPPVAEFREVP
ncbi:MAG: hypothetical protein ACN6RH_17980 [Stenotrophomonas rhizophila]|uniref:hypothetical protein n=1 Tax=Stenotrophomonas rhizophila TaxID=216778 RepID=UPI003D11819D